MSTPFETTEPTRAAIDARRGPLLLEFGSPTCGHCRRALPLVEQALAAQPGVAHVKVADGPGQPLGRSFGVKLWPTLIFLRDGVEQARAVRPQSVGEIAEGLQRVAAPLA
ncbi:MAG: thioredoxin family protein [Burkholderiales bacterium]|nr:thioredoxin family protein [Burkholderiales bacterium]